MLQDAVTRQAKFLTYKRGGQRVLINGRGDMVVRPSYVEMSIHNRPGASSVGQVQPFSAPDMGCDATFGVINTVRHALHMFVPTGYAHRLSEAPI